MSKSVPAIRGVKAAGLDVPVYASMTLMPGASGLETPHGVPIARIDFKYRENERKMMTEMYQTAAGILKEAKAEILPYDPTFMGVPGQAIHEHSTCRMGADPKRSALNGFCQMHDVKNVFVREDLLAGLNIMKTVLAASDPAAVIVFARNGNYLFGYALDHYKEDRELVPVASQSGKK